MFKQPKTSLNRWYSLSHVLSDLKVKSVGIEYFYDTYTVQLKNMQVFMTEDASEWNHLTPAQVFFRFVLWLNFLDF